MAGFNGSGTFERTYDWTTDEGNGINIEAPRMDTEDDGFATGLSTCITKDGQTIVTANIPMNSKKFTGLTVGSARTDSISLGQVQDGTYTTLGTAGGSADTYTATPSPAITAYATGSRYIIKINADNTGASTLNISAVGAKNIKKYDGAGAKVDVEAGDLQQDQYYDIFYDGTDIVVLNPQLPYIDLTNATKTAGQIVQVVNTQTGAVATGTTVIPSDDTIPQNTEGDEYMTLAITPTNASNILLIEVVISGAHTAAGGAHITALFQDSTSNALASTLTTQASASGVSCTSFIHKMTAGTTSSTTFKVRAGPNSAVTYTFNGSAGSRLLGGVIPSSITITEIKV
jgi:hypothetical protein